MPDEKPLRGREYLQAVRPEAMRHLLAFYGEAGRHLEPKTRFLISVLKQVINFSPRGLKQYIKRAMKEGATRDEVIDTILLAYPIANLTKLADSVDVLLDLEAVEGGPAGGGPAAGEDEAGVWHALGNVAAPAEGDCVHATVGKRELLIARHQGRLCALNDRCPHRGGQLSRGRLADGVVTCPLHGWNFRLADGGSAGTGLGGAETYPVRERTEGLEVRLPE
jgi:nitrite reductase/ring-hydroxylating ferredoxin subunit/alkylhydroperoxidase/carboxymuconolactone decarboxylase family protein YurZ